LSVVLGYVVSFSVREVNLSFIALIWSFVLGDFCFVGSFMSSKYEVYDSISLSMACTVAGRWAVCHGPRVHIISSFPLFVISYLPSSRRVTSPSWSMSSRSGVDDPGEGLHHPMLAFSTSVIIFSSVFGSCV